MSARTRTVAVLLLAVGAAVGCAPSGEAPGRVALDFYAAVDARDGEAACAVLAPTVAETVAEDAGTTCADAVTSGDLGADLATRASGASVVGVRVAGRQAQVRTGTDTVFLARSGSGWAVSAAGCDPRPDRPYDCEVAA